MLRSLKLSVQADACCIHVLWPFNCTCEPTTKHLVKTLIHPTDEAITNSFEFHHELVVRGYRFRPLGLTFNEEWIVNGAGQVPFLLNRKNACSFVECRPPLRHFAEFHQLTMTGVLRSVFSHTRRTPDGRILSNLLFGVFRWFKPSVIYRY